MDGRKLALGLSLMLTEVPLSEVAGMVARGEAVRPDDEAVRAEDDAVRPAEEVVSARG